MKTKLQILKESTAYVFSLGFLGGIFYSISGMLFSERFWDSWVAVVLIALLTFAATCFLMSYLFEKEKPLWIGAIKYAIIGICSTILTIFFTVIAFPFIVDILTNQVSDIWKSASGQNLLGGLIMIIPMMIIGFVFVIFGVLAFLIVAYFVGNWVFSFLLQWILVKYIPQEANKIKPR